MNVRFRFFQIGPALALALCTSSLRAQQSTPALDSLFDRREARIAMRDGVHLFTVILTPKHQSGPLPVLMSPRARGS